MQDSDLTRIGAWFAGPKAENGEWFGETVRRIVQDYHSWRRNYFPEDGVVVDSSMRRHNEAFQDAFEDRLIELLARLKADFPFQSPRYAAHMLAEQTLPSIAGYFAAMLYNPNNVSPEAAPVTVRLELEAARLLSRMLGYGPDAWGHLAGGGTVANFEALWIARSVAYLPLVVKDVRQALRLPAWNDSRKAVELLNSDPSESLNSLARTLVEAENLLGRTPETGRRIESAMRESRWNVAEWGVAAVTAALGSEPCVVLPETHHYCFEKAVDLLGLGRRSLISVPVDADFRMRADALEEAIDGLVKAGRHVIAVVAVVGSTEEGAVDPIDQIAALRTRRRDTGKGSFWLHADAAYGGYLRTVTVPSRMGLGVPETEIKIGGRVRRVPLPLPEHSTCGALEHLGECDSITIDPHKLGYVPYPAGAVCYKSRLTKHLARQNAPYLAERPSEGNTDGAGDAAGLYVLEGSKPGAAAAAVWLSHTLIPLDNTGHGILVQETIRNACELHTLLTEYPSLVPGTAVVAVALCSPGSNIVCYAFRSANKALTLAELNRANTKIYDRFTLRAAERVYDQSFFVSRTTIAPDRYSAGTCGSFLRRLGVSAEEYQEHGVFLLRSVLMNPWYAHAKRRSRYFISELASDLYRAAGEELRAATDA